jgi:hypothetical protein
MGELIGWLLLPIGWLVNKIKPFPTNEYFCRYVRPRLERAKELGIPSDEIQIMWDIAWKNTPDWTSPAIIFGRLIDKWEEDHNV